MYGNLTFEKFALILCNVDLFSKILRSFDVCKPNFWKKKLILCNVDFLRVVNVRR